jgi:hypothetical protein
MSSTTMEGKVEKARLESNGRGQKDPIHIIIILILLFFLLIPSVLNDSGFSNRTHFLPPFDNPSHEGLDGDGQPGSLTFV